ncbi:MAG TPA: zinc-dependent metalloprotease [Polyangiaceae bacterium]
MNANILRAFIVTGALASLCASSGCVADRPSRNGVFDENQYIRKDFLIRPGSGGQDPGWFLKTTILAASAPNPFEAGGLGVGSVASSALTVGGASYVNFTVSSDRLNMNNMIEPSQDQTLTGSLAAQGVRNQETIDSWAVTNVDLKYQVNLDGEKTNFYQENQELDWAQRQWVKLNFDKNDQSDFVTFGEYVNEFIGKCADTGSISAQLHPGSFMVDEANNYWQFAVDVTVPVAFNQLPSTSVASDGTQSTTYDTYCASQFGSTGRMFASLGKQNVTFTLMYSFMRAPEDPATSYDQFSQDPENNAKTYKPLVIPEKDPIQRKYGNWYTRVPAIDNSTGLWGSRQLAMRHDPAGAQFTYYFAPGFPEQYKSFWGTKQTSSTYPDGIYEGGGALVDQTNKLMQIAKANTKLVVMDFDANLQPGQQPRQPGDVRYSFLRWDSDLAQTVGGSTLAVTQPTVDPRSGQTISVDIIGYDWSWQDYILARLDYYEQTVGAFNFGNPGTCVTSQYGDKICVPTTCKDGDTMPLVPLEVQKNHNGTSTLFTKMQQYLGKPMATWGFLGPQDFVVQHSADFYNAFFKTIPYQVFSDPAANPYVTWEGGGATYGSGSMQIAAGMKDAQFQQLMSTIASGTPPYDVNNDLAHGGQDSANFLAQMQQLTIAHRDYEYIRKYAFPARASDSTEMLQLPNIFDKDARHCINGKWESRQDYVKNLIYSYYALTWWHEFGHSMGLNHNWMGSVDRNNFPHYKDGVGRDHIGLYTSSLMEYNITPDRVFWSGSSTNGGANGKPGWGPYDQSAIAFTYSNSSSTMNSLDSGKAKGVVGNSMSGESGTALDPAAGGKVVNQADSRWNDPLGYCTTGTTPASQPCTKGDEIQYLFCGEDNTRYSPFCQSFDFGTTPSEIIASEIDQYEWEYLWRNYPQYHQYFDFSPYANVPAGFFTGARRFLSTWAFDWAGSQLDDTFRRVGITPPAGTPEATYYDALDNEFNYDISMANQLYAATTQAIIQQSSGERPFVTTYDSYFGDTTQQGIAVDKSLALQAFTALWPIDNYDQNQAQGAYLSGFSFQADPGYEAVAEASCLSMVGGQYQMFPWAIPVGVQQFAQATHSVYYSSGGTGGRPEMKDWIGGYVFDRQIDFMDFFRNLAVIYNTVDAQGTLLCPTDSVETCTYDPTIKGSANDPEAVFHSDPFNQFIGPDNRRWIWVYLQDANKWIAADRDRNVATWVMMYNYTSDVLFGEDDGTIGNPYSSEVPLKYFLNYYQTNGN